MGSNGGGGNSNGSEKAFYEQQGRDREMQAQMDQMLRDQEAARQKAVADEQAKIADTSAQSNARSAADQAQLTAQSASQGATGAPSSATASPGQVGTSVTPDLSSAGIPNISSLYKRMAALRDRTMGGPMPGGLGGQSNAVSAGGGGSRVGGS